MKLVSIVLSCHNSNRDYIHQLMQGILLQTYTNWELIICDHESNVSTKNWFPNDKRIKHLGEYNKNDQWQYLINNSQGDIIIHHHDDDISLPHRLETQVKYLQEHKELNACSGGIITCGAIEGTIVCWSMKNEELQRQLMFRQHIMIPTLATLRDVKIDLIDDDNFVKIAKDFEWTSRRNDITHDIIDSILLKYRKHSMSDSALHINQIETDHANIVCRNLKLRLNIDSPIELGHLLNPHKKEILISKIKYNICMDIFLSNKDKIISYCSEDLYNLKLNQIKRKIITWI